MKQIHKHLLVGSAMIMLTMTMSPMIASADTTASDTAGERGRSRMERGAPGIGGEVTAKSGTVLTVKDVRSQTSYQVETSGATFEKQGAAATLGDIAVGDRVMVQGTVSGTAVTATRVDSGMMRGGRGEKGMGMERGSTTRMQLLDDVTGNGQPVVMGTVASVSGTTITMTNNGGTYTIDASAAKVTKPTITNATVASISVGDVLTVQGSVSGSSVVATTIIDHPKAAADVQSSSAQGAATKTGFFGRMGGFFGKLFGF